MPPPFPCLLGRFGAGALTVLGAAAAIACGNDTVSTTEAVEGFNRQVEVRDVKLTCPEEVDKGREGFECQLQGTKTGKTVTVRMAELERESDVLDVADGAAFRNAIEQVTRP